MLFQRISIFFKPIFCKHAAKRYCSVAINSAKKWDTVKSFVDKLHLDASRFVAFAERRPSHSSKLSQRISDICSKILSLQNELKDLESFTVVQQSEKVGDNDDLRNLALVDISERREVIFNYIENLVELIYPAIGSEIDAATIEISAGVGGQEAMIWANDLFGMYEKVAPSLGFKFDPVEYDHTDIGGARKAFATIFGTQAYKIMSFEGGIHRVQRVPKTERLGRIHTSTAAVVIMPQPSEIQVSINPSELTITTYRSSGPGGQHVNRTDSAVRIVHNPTGTIVTCQEERSQHRNREMALSKLRSILYERQLESQLSAERANRRLQAGTRSRSEKIRTYNWPRRKVTDHRLPSDIPGTHDLDDAIIGGQTLVNIIEALQATDREDRLLAMVQEFVAFK